MQETMEMTRQAVAAPARGRGGWARSVVAWVVRRPKAGRVAVSAMDEATDDAVWQTEQRERMAEMHRRMDVACRYFTVNPFDPNGR